MPKSTLEFTLPEEKEEFLSAVHGSAALAVLNNIETDFIRAKLKYNLDITPAQIDILEELRKFIRTEREDLGIPDEL